MRHHKTTATRALLAGSNTTLRAPVRGAMRAGSLLDRRVEVSALWSDPWQWKVKGLGDEPASTPFPMSHDGQTVQFGTSGVGDSSFKAALGGEETGKPVEATEEASAEGETKTEGDKRAEGEDKAKEEAKPAAEKK